MGIKIEKPGTGIGLWPGLGRGLGIEFCFVKVRFMGRVKDRLGVGLGLG
jgi:hypothetical protein